MCCASRDGWLPRRDAQLEINEWSQLLRDCEFKIGDRCGSLSYTMDMQGFPILQNFPKGEEYRVSSNDGWMNKM